MKVNLQLSSGARGALERANKSKKETGNKGEGKKTQTPTWIVCLNDHITDTCPDEHGHRIRDRTKEITLDDLSAPPTVPDEPVGRNRGANIGRTQFHDDDPYAAYRVDTTTQVAQASDAAGEVHAERDTQAANDVQRRDSLDLILDAFPSTTPMDRDEPLPPTPTEPLPASRRVAPKEPLSAPPGKGDLAPAKPIQVQPVNQTNNQSVTCTSVPVVPPVSGEKKIDLAKWLLATNLADRPPIQHSPATLRLVDVRCYGGKKASKGYSKMFTRLVGTTRNQRGAGLMEQDFSALPRVEIKRSLLGFVVRQGGSQDAVMYDVLDQLGFTLIRTGHYCVEYFAALREQYDLVGVNVIGNATVNTRVRKAMRAKEWMAAFVNYYPQVAIQSATLLLNQEILLQWNVQQAVGPTSYKVDFTDGPSQLN